MPLELEDHLRTMYQGLMNKKSHLLRKDYVSCGTRCLENIRQIREVDDEGLTMKKDYERKMTLLKLRSEEVSQRDFQLRKTVQKFSQYIEENDQKKNRAIKKYQDEREIVNAKNLEIEKMQTILSEATKYRGELISNLSKRQIFKDYLSSVRRMSNGEFSESKDIIARYETLKITKTELTRMTKDGIDAIEFQRGNLKRYTQETSERIIQYTMKIIELQKIHESMKNLLESIEDKVYHNVSDSQAVDFNMILMSIESIKDVIFAHQGKKTAEEDWQLENAVHILPQIREYMVFMKDVVTMVNKQLQNTQPTVLGCN